MLVHGEVATHSEYQGESRRSLAAPSIASRHYDNTGE
jgi:hypothetical protein